MTEDSLPSAENQSSPARRGLTPGSIVLLVGILAIIIVIGIQLTRQNALPVRSGSAPDFALNLYGGDSFILSEKRGSVVVVNFWGSWCPPCRDEAPLLQEAHEKYKDKGVTVLGIDFRDIDSAALQFIEENGITYPNGPDTGLRITEQWVVTGAPETYIIDPQGNVAEVFLGPLPDGWLEQKLDAILAAESAS